MYKGVASPAGSVTVALSAVRPTGETVSALLVFGVVTPLAAVQGGYFPVAWGWAGMALAAVGLIAVVLRHDTSFTRLERVWLAGWVALAGWTALSILWSIDVTHSVLAVERVIVYVGAAWALLTVAGQRSPRGMLVGALLAVALVSAYALATHLFPDRLGVYVDPVQTGRLNYPIGYWNALGIFAGMGYVMALGLAARPQDTALRVGAGGTMPMLLATVYFTFSRGAWLAMAAGAIAVIALLPGRLRYFATIAVLAPWSAIPVVVGARSKALTATTPVVAQVRGPGHELAWIVLVCCAASALAVGVFALIQRRYTAPRALRLGFACILVAGAIASAALAIHRYGSPLAMASEARAALEVTQPPASSSLGSRLFSLSLNGRPYLWRVARQEISAHPYLGGGAGSYERYWLAHRPLKTDVRDAHSLYLLTLAELGPLGLLILVAVLGAPFFAMAANRSHSLVPAAVGVYVAFLAHAAVDWDWRMPALALIAITCAASLLVLGRSRDRDISRRLITKTFLLAVPAVVFLIAVGGLLSNRALSASASAIEAHRWALAVRDARTAERWAPWSFQPANLAGQAQLAAANRGAAAREYRRAIALDSADVDAWTGLAQATNGPARRRALATAHGLNPFGP